MSSVRENPDSVELEFIQFGGWVGGGDLGKTKPLHLLSLCFAQFISFFFFFFLIVFILSDLYTWCGAQTHDPEIKRHMFFWLSQPGAPSLSHSGWLISICSSDLSADITSSRELSSSSWKLPTAVLDPFNFSHLGTYDTLIVAGWEVRFQH